MAKEAVQLDASGYRKFGIRDSIAYAAGDFACNMSFALKGTMAIFWTQFMRLDLYYAALLIVVQVWDAINDPLIGSIVDADRRQYKRNKFLQYIWAGSIGLIVGGACCFLPFPDAPTWAKMIIFVAGYVVWDAFYTVVNVPYGSLLSLISNDPADRASLSAWRSIGSLAGNVIPMVVLPFIIYDKDQNLVGERVFIAALLMGVAAFLLFQFMIKNTVIRVETDTVLKEDAPKFNVFKALGNFTKNRPAIGATLAAVGMFIGMQGAATAVIVLFQSYFRNVKYSGLIMMFSMLPTVIFTPFVRKLVTRYGKKEMATFGAVISLIACTGMLILPITPDNTGMIIYMACMFVYSIGLGIYILVSWAMMGDAIDYNEWKFGTREEGTVYALHSFFRKLAQGAGPALALVIMVALGYVGANEGNQTAEVALRMRYLVAALYFVSAAMQFIGLGLVYNLDKKDTARMQAELKARKAEAAYTTEELAHTTAES